MREPIVPQLEGDEYLLWEARQSERHELHHGFVVAFSGGTRAHGTIALNLQIVLRRVFPSPCETFGSDVKIEISASTFLYPDASVSCEPADDDASSIRSPLFVAEILSKSTRSYDLVEKRAFYRSLPSLRTYLIVHTEVRCVDVDTIASGVWQTHRCAEETVALGSSLVTFDEIYAQTSVR